MSSIPLSRVPLSKLEPPYTTGTVGNDRTREEVLAHFAFDSSARRRDIEASTGEADGCDMEWVVRGEGAREERNQL